MIEASQGKKIFAWGAMILGAVCLIAALIFLPSRSPNIQNFYTSCNEKIKNESEPVCDRLSKQYKSSRSPFESINLKKIGLYEFSGDKYIAYHLFPDPIFAAASTYCYFIYLGWIDKNTISPKIFSQYVGGFTVLQQDVEKYSNWIRKKDGVACKRFVKKELAMDAQNLAEILGNKKALVGIKSTWNCACLTLIQRN